MKPVSTQHLCFDVLANPLRIRIIQSLRKGEKSVGELGKELGVEQSRLSHSLDALKRCQFVESERSGKKVICALRKEFQGKLEADDIFTALGKHYAEHGAKCWRKGK